MTNQEKRVVLESFQQIAPASERAGEVFYEKLFALDPSLRPMFADDISVQSQKFIQMLALGVRGLDDPETLVSTFRDLGRKHVAYGVKTSHYETAHLALIGMLEDLLGDRFTTEVREAWDATYRELQDAMAGVETP